MVMLILSACCHHWVSPLTASPVTHEAVAETADSLIVENYRKDFINGNHNIADFVIDLYDRYDIVILGERDHRDTVQYSFVKDIISDSRFIENVGHVYTEVGCNSATENANDLITRKFRNESEFKSAAVVHLRQEEWWPLWEKWNRYKFLRDLSNINDTLSVSRKIIVGLTDVDYPWDRVKTADEYERFYNEQTANRDSIMARNFCKMYRRQIPRNGKQKALLITNAPHAINNPAVKNEGWLLKQEFGDKVVIVLMNWDEWWQDKITLLDNGRVDAAFCLADNEPTAIMLHENAIGNISAHNQKLKDVADAMIFDVPINEFVCKCGLDGLITTDFEKEIVRRDSIVHKVVYPNRKTSSLDAIYREYNRERCFSPYSDEVLQQFLRWCRIYGE